MRTLLWIFGTLLSRSWLVICGVGIGLLARNYFPPTATTSTVIVDPKAKAYYDSIEYLVEAKPAAEVEPSAKP
ncbi:MAG: hypothetical protein JNL67_09100 [Planctomycetaceae bacterium]|nr:hypothetical protein [Planctomycetaceae bacterium]